MNLKLLIAFVFCFALVVESARIREESPNHKDVKDFKKWFLEESFFSKFGG